MEGSGKDCDSPDSSLPASSAHQEGTVPGTGMVVLKDKAFSSVSWLDKHLNLSDGQLQLPGKKDVIITPRLRDREMLRRRREEAHNKDVINWVLSSRQRRKYARRGRGAGRGRSRWLVVKPSVEREPEPEPTPQPDPPEEAVQAPRQSEPPQLMFEDDLLSDMQLEALDEELAAINQDPPGEEEVLKPEEAGMPKAALNTPLEYE